jgi:hypothetical protein
VEALAAKDFDGCGRDLVAAVLGELFVSDAGHVY